MVIFPSQNGKFISTDGRVKLPKAALAAESGGRERATKRTKERKKADGEN
jgi:hypothetical protein